MFFGRTRLPFLLIGCALAGLHLQPLILEAFLLKGQREP